MSLSSDVTTAAGVRLVCVHGLAKIKAFSHASIYGGVIRVAGCVGTVADSMDLVDGGLHAETTQVLQNIERIVVAAGGSLASLLKVNVYLVDNTPERFAEMNAAYIAYFGDVPVPPRITVGCSRLALGAAVECDAEAAVLSP